MSKPVNAIQGELKVELLFKELSRHDTNKDFDKIIALYEKIFTEIRRYAEQDEYALTFVIQLHNEICQRFNKLEASDGGPEIELKLKELTKYIKLCEVRIRSIAKVDDKVSLYSRPSYANVWQYRRLTEQDPPLAHTSHLIKALDDSRKIVKVDDSVKKIEPYQALKPIYQYLANNNVTLFGSGLSGVTDIISEYFDNDVGLPEIVNLNTLRKNTLSYLKTYVAVFSYGKANGDKYSDWSHSSIVSPLIHRLVDDEEHPHSSIAASFSQQRFGRHTVTLVNNNFYDTNELTPSYMQIKMLVFDVTSESSFNWAQTILGEKDKLHQFKPSDKIILVATNIDQYDGRAVDSARILSLASDYNIPYCEVSSTTGANIENLKTILIAQLNELHPYKPAVQQQLQTKESKGCSIM